MKPIEEPVVLAWFATIKDCCDEPLWETLEPWRLLLRAFRAEGVDLINSVFMSRHEDPHRIFVAMNRAWQRVWNKLWLVPEECGLQSL